jgi:hypothetical protein
LSDNLTWSNREKLTILGQKLISHFGNTNNIFTDCMIKISAVGFSSIKNYDLINTTQYFSCKMFSFIKIVLI